MEKHVPTKETCQRLQELGVELYTEFYWYPDDAVGYNVGKANEWRDNKVPAPLLSEILQMLPDGTSMRKTHIDHAKYEVWKDGVRKNITADTAAEAACRLLIWFLENDHVNPEDLWKLTALTVDV